MAENAILTEQDISGFWLNESFGLYCYVIQKPASLVAGETYTVAWDGDTHTCTAQDASALNGGNEMIAIGNGAAFGMVGNNEPFIIATAEDSMMFYVVDPNDTSETHSVGISQVTEEDKQYLIWGSTLKEIGNAIREKTGGTASLSPADMPTEIRGITGGGVDVDVVYITFMSHDGATQLYKKPVVVGDDSCDPVTNKLMETPTRESTAEYHFTFAGWATTANGGLDENALNAVTADRTVYANYIATVRYYTISYYDDDGTLLHSESLAYGSTPSYTPEKDGYIFNGWEEAVTAVMGDASYTATWRVDKLLADYTWDEIAAFAESGEAANVLKLGDTKTFTAIVNSTTKTFTAKIIGFNHDDLADGSGKAGISFEIIDFPEWRTATYGWSWGSITPHWPETDMQKTYLDTLVTNAHNYNGICAELVSHIKKVNKKYYHYAASSYKEYACYLWPYSRSEIGISGYAEGDCYPIFSSGKNTSTAYPELVRTVNGTTYLWWLRSMLTSSNATIVNASGQVTTKAYGQSNANHSYLACFCI